MGEVIAELGRTVRYAVGSNARTARLAALMLVTLISIIVYGIML